MVFLNGILIYEENGYRVNRDTIRDDIKALNEAGVEILSHRVGKGKAHHIGARGFELSELKMLVDAVSSSQFITKAESDSLIRKVTQLTNEDNRPTLTARIFTADRIKSSNTSVLYATDAICRAMDTGKKICFHYWTYDSHKNHVLRSYSGRAVFPMVFVEKSFSTPHEASHGNSFDHCPLRRNASVDFTCWCRDIGNSCSVDICILLLHLGWGGDMEIHLVDSPPRPRIPECDSGCEKHMGHSGSKCCSFSGWRNDNDDRTAEY